MATPTVRAPSRITAAGVLSNAATVSGYASRRQHAPLIPLSHFIKFLPRLSDSEVALKNRPLEPGQNLESLPSVMVTMVQSGQTNMTIRAIDSIRRSRYGGSIQITVYDNGSPSGPGVVANLEGVRFIQGQEDVGFGLAHNTSCKE